MFPDLPNGAQITTCARGLWIWPTWRDGQLHWAGHSWTPRDGDGCIYWGACPDSLWRAWNDTHPA
jgi:hypothetical protein